MFDRKRAEDLCCEMILAGRRFYVEDFSFLKMFREDLLVTMAALKESRTPAALGRRRAPERCGRGAICAARARCGGGSAGEVRFAKKYEIRKGFEKF